MTVLGRCKFAARMVNEGVPDDRAGFAGVSIGCSPMTPVHRGQPLRCTLAVMAIQSTVGLRRQLTIRSSRSGDSHIATAEAIFRGRFRSLAPDPRSSSNDGSWGVRFYKPAPYGATRSGGRRTWGSVPASSDGACGAYLLQPRPVVTVRLPFFRPPASGLDPLRPVHYGTGRPYFALRSFVLSTLTASGTAAIYCFLLVPAWETSKRQILLT